MKKRIVAGLILSLMITLNACGPTKGVAPIPVKVAVPPDEQSYQQAERIFERGDYPSAVNDFLGYLAKFPQGVYADRALLRIAQGYAQMGQFSEAVTFFQQLLQRHPQSPLVPTARMEMLAAVQQLNKPELLIQTARPLLDLTLTPEERDHILVVLAEASTRIGAQDQAVIYWHQRVVLSPETRRPAAVARLVAAIDQLTADQVGLVLDHILDDSTRSYLFFRFAVLQIMAANYDDGLELLKVFLHTFPNHERADEARQLVAAISQQFAFAPRTLGCLLPLTGPYHIYGQRALKGIELALSKQTSTSSAPIRLIIKDTGSSDAKAAAAVQSLADARVAAILGPIITAETAARQAQQLNVPIVTFTQKQGVADIGDYVFRHFITPHNQAKTLVDYMVNRLNVRRFAILYPNEPYGTKFMQLFWDEVTQNGAQVVGVEHYDADQTDFAAAIKKLVGTYYTEPAELTLRPMVRVADPFFFTIDAPAGDPLRTSLPDPVARLTGLYFETPDQIRSSGPLLGRPPTDQVTGSIVDFDAVFIPDAPKSAGLIIPQLAYYDVKTVYLLGTNLWHSANLIKMSKDYAQNAIMTDGFFVDSQGPIVRQFVTDFKAVYNQRPGLIEAYAFDTARLLFELVQRPDISLRNILRDELLRTVKDKGVTGPTVFAENGEAEKTLYLLRVKGSRFVELQR